VSGSPVKSLGTWRAVEAGYEAGLPLVLCAVSWWVASKLLASPVAERPPTNLELAAMLGACVALTAWAMSRQFFLLRRRNPWQMILVAEVFSVIAVGSMPRMTRGTFAERCGELMGEVVTVNTYVPHVDKDLPLHLTESTACVVGGVAGNPYLPGVIYRPSWPDSLPVEIWVFLAIVAIVATLAFRDRRLMSTRLGLKLFDKLRLAPGMGVASAAGKPKATPGNVQACGNSTFWGEVCGQMYSADKVFLAGERCVRCHQPYQKSKDELTFTVVTLFTGDVDVLNGLERIDTNAWPHGGTIPPDGRISGQERWVTLGRITVPAVLSVSQTLSMVHEQLKEWQGSGKPDAQEAAKLAEKRASRIAAWIWFGRLNHLLTYASPTRRSMLAIGPMRLKDLVPHAGEELTLQLDIGLLPLDLWVGSKTTFGDGRNARLQNSHFTMWIPTSPPKVTKANLGVWVPRVEGKALRAWLSTDRIKHQDDESAGSIPLPYKPLAEQEDDLTPADEVANPTPGSLDLIRRPVTGGLGDQPRPIIDPGSKPVGSSISEWAWLEWEQIQLLRQQALVLEDSDEEGA
jgi:hypothetical protein